MLSGGRTQFIALKAKTPWLDINQERHHPYAGYDGMVELVRQIDLAIHNPVWADVRAPAPWDRAGRGQGRRLRRRRRFRRRIRARSSRRPRPTTWASAEMNAPSRVVGSTKPLSTGEDRSRLQGRQRQSAEVVAAARRGLRLSRRRRRRAAVPRLAGLHVLRAGPVRPPLQGDDPAPDDGDGRGRDHPRRRRPPRGGDPQSEGPRQAEADRHRHHRAGRDARRGLWRRARRDQGAPGRGTRRDGGRARPDARFRRRDRGGLVEGGRRDDRVDRPSGGSRAPQRAAGQYPAGLAS